jgi:uncharacterized protein
MVITVAIPVPAIMDLANSHPIRLISPADDEIKKITSAMPYYTDNFIPANTYRGVDYEVKTVSSPIELVARADMPDEIAYTVTKTLLDNWKEILNVHQSAKDVTLQSAPKMAIPLHPGSLRYFREKGLIK